MYKGCIFIGNILNNVSIGLGCDHVDFRYFQALIIAHVLPEIPESHVQYSMATKSSLITDDETWLPWQPLSLPW